MLAGIWTRAFIDAFRDGNSLSMANFIANSEVKESISVLGLMPLCIYLGMTYYIHKISTMKNEN